MKIAQYKGLEIGKIEYDVVTPEEVEKEIANLLASKISTKDKEGAAVLGDTVTIDFEGFLDDVPFEGGKGENYDLELGSNSFIPGFEDQLVGANKGDDVNVNVTFPEEYHADNLAGKPAVFKCHVHAVKEKVEPELNDELAQSFGIPTAVELRAELERQMNAKKENEAQNEYLNKLVKQVTEATEFDELPEDQVKARIDDMVSYYEQQIAGYGMDLNSFLGMSGQTLEQFRDQVTANAIESVKADVLFDAIAAAESLAVADSEVEKELSFYKQYYQMDDTAYDKFVSEKKNDIATDMVRRKVSEFLLANND